MNWEVLGTQHSLRKDGTPSTSMGEVNSEGFGGLR